MAHALDLEYGEETFAYFMAQVATFEGEKDEENAETWRELAKIINPVKLEALDPQMMLPGLSVATYRG